MVTVEVRREFMKKMSKKLNLCKETLRALTDGSLENVAGGALTRGITACLTNCISCNESEIC